MYNTSTMDLYDTAEVMETATTGAAQFMFVYILIILALGVVSIISMWKIFTKAGKPGWAAIIPVYNTVVMFQIAGVNPLWLLLLIGSFIPVVNFITSIVFLVISILVDIKLVKAFGKSGAFAVGLILLPLIFQCILAFDKSEYEGIQA